MKRIIIAVTVLAVAATALAGEDVMDQLLARLDSLQAKIESLEEQVAEKDFRIAELEAENAELRKHLPDAQPAPEGDPDAYVVYWEKPRSKEWFEEMYQKYKGQIVAYRGHPRGPLKFVGIGESLLDPYDARSPRVEWLCIIKSSRVKNIAGPRKLVVTLPPRKFRSPRGRPYETHEQDVTILVDTSEYQKGDNYSGEVLSVTGGTFVPRRDVTKAEFKAALDEGFQLITYEKKGKEIEKTYER